MGNMDVVSINTTLFWQIINFLVLVWIFKRFFFKPLSKIIQEGKEEITADIDSAKKDREAASELKIQLEKEIKTAKSEAQQVVAEAVKKAENAKEEILKEAHAQREKMMKSAEADILKMKESAKRESVDIVTGKDFASHASEDNKNDLIYEVADLWFHSIVMLGYFDIDPQIVLNELARRQGLSGLVEKANRAAH